MTTSRALYVLLMMVAVGLVIVGLRAESAKTANRVQKLHHRKVVLEQRLWAREMELARLRGPEAIRGRASELGLDLIPPKVRSDTKPAAPAAD